MTLRAFISISFLAALTCGCRNRENERTMVVIDPGHFHAALIQKHPVPGVSGTVKVFAPEGEELDTYLSTIESFNSRDNGPTYWTEDVHTGDNFLEMLPEADDGDFVVLAGNNRNKTEYIRLSIEKGYNVLSDKPMAITHEDFEALRSAISEARKKHLVILDMMTERHDIYNILIRRMVQDKEFFGEIDSLSFSSIHHFYKNVAGVPLKRPSWYYDVRQQGEGIADVTTHLIDLAFWSCNPGESIAENDISDVKAHHYPTPVTLEQFRKSTGAESFPAYLEPDLKGGILQVMSNGDLSFKLRGIPVDISVRWDFEAPSGSGDTSESLYKGSKATIRLVQNKETGFNRKLMVSAEEDAVRKIETGLKADYPFISFSSQGGTTWSVDIPVSSISGHEEHFGLVAKSFIEGMQKGNVPAWEYDNMLAKYRITTSAVTIAAENSSQIDD